MTKRIDEAKSKVGGPQLAKGKAGAKKPAAKNIGTRFKTKAEYEAAKNPKPAEAPKPKSTGQRFMKKHEYIALNAVKRALETHNSTQKHDAEPPKAPHANDDVFSKNHPAPEQKDHGTHKWHVVNDHTGEIVGSHEKPHHAAQHASSLETGDHSFSVKHASRHEGDAKPVAAPSVNAREPRRANFEPAKSPEEWAKVHADRMARHMDPKDRAMRNRPLAADRIRHGDNTPPRPASDELAARKAASGGASSEHDQIYKNTLARERAKHEVRAQIHAERQKATKWKRIKHAVFHSMFH